MHLCYVLELVFDVDVDTPSVVCDNLFTKHTSFTNSTWFFFLKKIELIRDNEMYNTRHVKLSFKILSKYVSFHDIHQSKVEVKLPF